MIDDEEIERRLRNWARWKLSGGDWRGAGVRSGSGAFPWSSGQRSGYYKPVVVPILAAEAGETDRAIATLSLELQGVLRGWYIGLLPGGGRMSGVWGQADLARELECSRSTLQRRLADGRQAVMNALILRRVA